MTRVIIRFKDGEYLNIPADYMDYRKGFVMAWNGDFLVAMVRAKEVVSCHISEQNYSK